ncbi:recombinase family protein [Proteiniclasticum ruminis]|uniref:Site-specific DNA recombinase n=1 Tax=Proteiniclasticum ruminis TaxID=398199 RepID=A0A1G8I529_9CLOT|nr:recombinase family protein [Proteiniclasticum ruminis]SDI14048.1 Site-specific DNA recombinase [Proteiniclasticum ruminis]
MKDNEIKNVAIYLRKSRDDGDEDILRKHRMALTDFAHKNRWKYELFEEDAISGEFLNKRPIVSQLLDRIENLEFDAILVKALDRLSRGDEAEYGELLRVLRNSDCSIVTPERVYNPSDLNESMVISINGIFAHRELNAIVNRLQEGKKYGAKEGKMTNGKPPYPYYYHKEIIDSDKGQKIIPTVRVDPEKHKIYEKIKELYIAQNMGTERIAFFLNQRGISSPNGKNWTTATVSRLLLHEFHMGVAIYGKTQWKENRAGKIRVVKLPREKWHIGRGDWPIIKTESEHNEILRITQQNLRVPSRAKQGAFPTSGIMFCQKCGYSMRYSLGKLEAKSGKVYNYTKCSHKNPMGKKCEQRGVKMDENFYNTLYNTISKCNTNKRKVLEIAQKSERLRRIEIEIEEVQRKIEDIDKQLKRIKAAYAAGVYTLEELKIEKKDIEVKKKSLLSAYQNLSEEREGMSMLSEKELSKRVENFKEKWANASSEEKNALLKSFIKKIVYNREGNKITLSIEYQ